MTDFFCCFWTSVPELSFHIGMFWSKSSCSGKRWGSQLIPLRVDIYLLYVWVTWNPWIFTHFLLDVILPIFFLLQAAFFSTDLCLVFPGFVYSCIHLKISYLVIVHTLKTFPSYDFWMLLLFTIYLLFTVSTFHPLPFHVRSICFQLWLSRFIKWFLKITSTLIFWWFFFFFMLELLR